MYTVKSAGCVCKLIAPSPTYEHAGTHRLHSSYSQNANCQCLDQRSVQIDAECDLQAIVPTITKWIIAVVDSVWEPPTSKLNTKLLGSDLFRISSNNENFVWGVLVCTVTVYLDSQQRWHEFAQDGLCYLLLQLCASMQRTAKLSVMQYEDQVQMELRWYLVTLGTASRFCFTPDMPVAFTKCFVMVVLMCEGPCLAMP